MRFVVRTALFFVPILCVSSVVHAESVLSSFFVTPDVSPSLSLVFTPSAPEPRQKVHISTESAYADASHAAFTWYVNGKLLSESSDTSEIDLTAPALGTTTKIRVTINASDGTTLEAKAILTSAEIDLLYDSNSFVPAFYEGRSIAGEGTTVRLEARARVTLSSGLLADPRDLIYTWKKDDRTIQGSGLGKSALRTEAPGLYETALYNVEVALPDGSRSTTRQISISSQRPDVILYEDHPLLGTLLYRAVTSDSSFPDSEIAIVGMPYFAPIADPRDKNLLYEWTVNGIDIKPSEAAPNALTLSSQTGTSLARVALTLTHDIDIFYRFIGQWNLTLGAKKSDSRAQGTTNPFTQ